MPFSERSINVTIQLKVLTMQQVYKSIIYIGLCCIAISEKQLFLSETPKAAQWLTACPRTKTSAVQVSAMGSCSGGELFTYI